MKKRKDPGGPKTCGSNGCGSESRTLVLGTVYFSVKYSMESGPSYQSSGFGSFIIL